MKTISSILTLVLATSAIGQSPCAIVADLNTGNGGKDSSSPRRLQCAFGGSMLFYARAGTTWDLYRAATNGQLQILAQDANADIVLTPCSTPQGARVFFVAKHPTAGKELHSTDGTVAGTKLIRDIRPGSLPPSYGLFTPFGDRMLFIVYDFKIGWEPWVTDGSTAGTVRLGDLRTGSAGSDPRDITPAGDYALFTADDGVTHRELWITNGTPLGTMLLKDIGGTTNSWPKDLIRFGNRVLFSAHEPNAGRELWISDGTTNGTVRLLDINPGTASSYPSSFTVLGDRVFFVANDGTHGYELWTTDGTVTGTKMVVDLKTTAGNSDPMFLTACHGKVYFIAGGISQGTPHVSDGTAAGTIQLSKLVRGVREFIPSNGKVFFAGSDHLGQELWVTNGTAAGTSLTKDINPGGWSARVFDITPMGSGVSFNADDGTTGEEPWFSDGTATGTTRICDLNPGAAGSSPKELTTCGGHLFFNATTVSRGQELFWIKTPGATTERIHGASEPGHPALSIKNSRHPVLGSSLEIVGTGPANHAGFLVIGLPTELPLPPVPGLLSRGTDWVAALTPASIIATSTASTKLSLPVTVPSSTSFDGARLNLQAWWLPLAGPLQFQVSNGVQLTLGTGTPR